MNDQAQVDELLDRWEEHWELGEEIAVEELCQEAPELAEEVRFQVRALKGTNWLFEPDDEDCDFLTLPPLETMMHAETVSVPAAVSLDEFASSIVSSGLMTTEQLSRLRSHSDAANAQAFVNKLIREGKLTPYQVKAVVDGNTKGLVLGNYVILDRVGAGGMGQVFLAKHRIMKRVAALKVLPETAVKSANAVERFHREVEAAARLKHPNIVTTYDADQANGLHFFVMEHIAGDDLSAVVRKRGRLSVAKALDCVIQSARGLEYAHKQGVIHRDIKPGNLLLDAEGTVKILDMGLARLQTTSDTDRYAPTQAELTQDGSVFGTVDYMSPEQALNSKDVDARADIYSLGCTLYNLLTGRPLYQGESLMGKMLAHRENEIPVLHEVRTGVPERLSEIFAKMVAKKAEHRYPTMSALLADLEALAEDVVKEDKSEATMKNATAVSPSRVDLQAKETSSASIGDTVDYSVRVAPKPAKPQSSSDGVSRRAWFTGGGVVAIGLAILGYLYFAGIIFKVETPDGIIQIETNVTDVEVSVDGQQAVTITNPNDKSKVTVKVKPGGKVLSVTKDGFEADVTNFQLKTVKGPIKVTFAPIPVAKDHDREVAEWVLSIGGSVSVLIGEDTVAVTALDQLTDRSFAIIDVGLRANKEVTDNDLSRFNGLRHLEDLNLVGTNIRDVGVLRLNDLPSLSGIGLLGTKITNDALTNLERFPMLRTLSLEHTQIDDRALEGIGKVRTLTTLHVEETRCTEAGLRHLQGLEGLSTLQIGSGARPGDFNDSLVEQLKVFKQLDNLTIGGSSLTDDGLKNLVRVCPQIQSLGLRSSELTDEGMKHLKSLPRLSGLLNLGCHGLTDASIEHLKELNAGAFMLHNTKITAKGIDELHKARPKVQINWTGGTVLPETRSPLETETTEALKRE